MGLGYALMEALVVDEGEIQNASLEGYLIPTSLDRPPLRSETVEIPEPFAPYGAKGLGESPLAPVAPAIANAVSDALGVPLNDLPLSPERVLRAISERKQP
jgi:CO/xanthine dehydrogenase Mo-binding subunit